MTTAPATGYLAYRPPPEALPELARRAEAAGFDEFWLYQDPYYGGPIALAASALAATERIRVGIAIMPAAMHHPVSVALEIATLARLHPGRFLPGFGHGVPSWMRQIGAMPQSPLSRLEETLTALHGLLAGETVTMEGRYVRLRGVQLEFAPDEVPPILAGVERARSLALSGRIADGTILDLGSTLEYVAWAREQIAATRPHRIVAVEWSAIARDAAAARAILRPRVQERLRHPGPQLEVLDPPPTEATDDLIDRSTICGTAADCAARIVAIGAAGADSVVIIPAHPDLGPEDFAPALPSPLA